ncbi:fumarylacetoacetate hydrolase family protein [Pseudonocardia sp. ICBG1034]|uniref:fumarylacetoacetate hydrolase family protein n=1 Tax=Pseudonocardia sp. ICBG1034 TaxID=2844381 RepID=UPI001CCAA9FB|nr:fumarylacetoacetate hydrolase family protein [Pseudonocardia sp. ICBG1034]
MRIALFDADRVGLVDAAGESVVDCTDLLPHHDPGLGANYWVRLCADLDRLREPLLARFATGPRTPLAAVRLRAPVLNPGKIIAAAANYADHIDEMRPHELADWLLAFDLFLKAPSSVVGPGAVVRLPDVPGEVHYECELGLVLARGGYDIPAESALDHILGWTVLLDITERGKGDRSRRKSYDGFTPVGPWLVTRDEAGDWTELAISLRRNGELAQQVKAGEMLVGVPEIIARASRVMTLQPGDVIATGAPAGVGQIEPGDRLDATIDGIGTLTVTVG